MKLTSIQNINFKAKCSGDYERLKNFSKDYGLDEKKIKETEDRIQHLFPSDEDTLVFHSQYSEKYNGTIIKVTLQNKSRNLNKENSSVKYAIPLKNKKDYKNLFLCLAILVERLSLNIP